MKFAATLALAIAPLALAKSVHNVYPVRRENSGKSASNSNSKSNNNNNNNNGQGLVLASQTTEIIIIWQNAGAGAATTTVNNQVTVTQTVTAGAAAATVVGTATVSAGATGTVAGTGATHSVVVGGSAGLQYTPASINAAVGDMVVFTFMSNNHTVTQSAFATPCDPLASGMDSSFQPNPNNTISPPPQVAMQVMVATPLWFYCKQTKHCGQGMTFSINPTADKTQAMFQAMAIAQKGTGQGSAITGNGTASGSASGSASSSAASAVSSAASAASSASTAGTASSSGSVQQGLGTLVAGSGQCVCAVSCATGSFPAVQAQGLGAFGGLPGQLPSNMVEVV